jgi:hypothetical protein
MRFLSIAMKVGSLGYFERETMRKTPDFRGSPKFFRQNLMGS